MTLSNQQVYPGQEKSVPTRGFVRECVQDALLSPSGKLIWSHMPSS